MARPIFTDQTTSTIFFAIGGRYEMVAPPRSVAQAAFFYFLLIDGFLRAWPMQALSQRLLMLSRKYLKDGWEGALGT